MPWIKGEDIQKISLSFSLDYNPWIIIQNLSDEMLSIAWANLPGYPYCSGVYAFISGGTKDVMQLSFNASKLGLYAILTDFIKEQNY